MVNRKPKGWDIMDDVSNFIKRDKTGVTKKVSDAGNKLAKGTTGAMKYAFGDPKKGWQNVASESAMWLVPYGKIGKGAKAVVKNRKVIGKVASGAAQTAVALTAKPAADKALAKTRKPKTTKHMVSGKKPPKRK
jgi:hypothetical protein